MENKLKSMFEYQNFSHNKRIDALRDEANARYNAALSDEDLLLVSAAGGAINNSGEKTLDGHFVPIYEEMDSSKRDLDRSAPGD